MPMAGPAFFVAWAHPSGTSMRSPGPWSHSNLGPPASTQARVGFADTALSAGGAKYHFFVPKTSKL